MLASADLVREYMTKAERRDYIQAVQCLQTRPSKSDPTWAPAARSRYDDFVAIHVNQTLFIHGNGLFLTWHRYFVWAYEQALRDECGYKGYQPVGSITSRLQTLGSVWTNVDSTGIGSRTLMTYTSRQCLMVATPAWVAMARLWHTMEALLVPALFSSHQAREVDALQAVLSKSKHIAKLDPP